jgi:hypothetical protein
LLYFRSSCTCGCQRSELYPYAATEILFDVPIYSAGIFWGLRYPNNPTYLLVTIWGLLYPHIPSRNILGTYLSPHTYEEHSGQFAVPIYLAGIFWGLHYPSNSTYLSLTFSGLLYPYIPSRNILRTYQSPHTHLRNILGNSLP